MSRLPHDWFDPCQLGRRALKLAPSLSFGWAVCKGTLDNREHHLNPLWTMDSTTFEIAAGILRTYRCHKAARRNRLPIWHEV